MTAAAKLQYGCTVEADKGLSQSSRYWVVVVLLLRTVPTDVEILWPKRPQPINIMFHIIIKISL